MKVLFIAGFGPIVPTMDGARPFYAGALGLPLTGDATYMSTSEIDGVKHFALWPLSGAAQSCFGVDQWPGDIPAPQGWIEFDVDDVAAATSSTSNSIHPCGAGMSPGHWSTPKHDCAAPDNGHSAKCFTPSISEVDM